MELKIEDLKTGDALECVDHKGFTLGKRAVNEPILEMKEIIVQSISSKNLIYVHDKNNSDNFFIYESELKYFKKKEQSQQYTFDDLIDVVRKAFDDHVLTKYSVESLYVDYLPIEYRGRDRSKPRTKCLNLCGVSVESRNNLIQKEIDFIQSLYKETFVIETEEDLNRISGVVNSVVLSNGEEIINIIRFHKNKPCFAGSIDRVDIPFCVLKGATVTQSK